MAANREKVEGRFYDNVYLDRRRAIFRQRETIGDGSLSHGLCVGCEGYGAARATVVGIDSPLGLALSLSGEEVLGLHSYKALRMLELIAASSRGVRDSHAGGTGQKIAAEIIVPRTVANMLLRHHTVPLAIGNFLVIGQTEQRVTTETLADALAPLVGIGIILRSQMQVHSLGVIHVVEVGHGLYREE